MLHHRRVLGAILVGSIFLSFSVSVQAAGKKPAHRQPPIVPPGWPKVLIVPRMSLTAGIEPIPLSKPSDYDAPRAWRDVAWYDRGYRPGDIGHSNIFGHLDSYCCPAAFYQLRLLQRNDPVEVRYRNGKVLTFRVQWQAIYPNDKLPASFLFGPARDRGLVLMTCTGIFHRDGTGYDHKLVVYARLVLPNGKLG